MEIAPTDKAALGKAIREWAARWRALPPEVAPPISAEVQARSLALAFEWIEFLGDSAGWPVAEDAVARRERATAIGAWSRLRARWPKR